MMQDTDIKSNLEELNIFYIMIKKIHIKNINVNKSEHKYRHKQVVQIHVYVYTCTAQIFSELNRTISQ